MDHRIWLLLLFLVHAASCQSSCSVASSDLICTTEGQVCIVQTQNFDAPNTGRVQICIGGRWGTIGESSNNQLPWRDKNAQTACRQAGFSGAINSIFPLTISSADTAPALMPVHYADMRCTGNHANISSCSATFSPTSFVAPNGFIHFSDAFVVCRPETQEYSDVHTGGVEAGDMRLFADSSNEAGAVEVYFPAFGWVSLCPQGFDNDDAAFVCEQFGYDTGIVRIYTPGLEQTHPRRLYDAECSSTGNPPLSTSSIQLGKCSYRITGSANACPTTSFQYAGVVCSSSASEGDIRFFGGTSALGGIVEVFYAGRWGMVCTRGDFALTEARTVCEQQNLNEDDATSMSATSLLDEESRFKPIWLAGVDCTTSSQRFTSCSREEAIGYGECGSSSIAASRCGQPDGSLPGGAITGIVIAVTFFVFFVVPIGYYLIKGFWGKREEHGWYRRLTRPSSWCDCSCDCCDSTPRRNFNINTTRSNRTQPRAEITLASISTEPVDPPVQFGGFTGGPSSAAAVDTQPTAGASAYEKEEDSDLTKQAPPTYNTSENYPTFSAPPQDLPPPYPGPAAVGFPDPAYPPPVAATAPPPTAPPPQSGYPDDPAYPPAQLPYPVNQEVGGGAYPPPTFPSEPST